VDDGETTIRADLLEVERRIGGFRWRERKSDTQPAPNSTAILPSISPKPLTESQQ
jgi:hypothetical protein